MPDRDLTKLLVLVSDAYGGRGGIAKFNRDMLASVIEHAQVGSITVLPRVIVEEMEAVPAGIEFRADVAGSLAKFSAAVVAEMIKGNYDGVICGHINLLPFGRALARRRSVPLLLVIHGIDAWQPTGRRLTDRSVTSVDRFVVVSDFT
ncbi:MAG: hypothetical protein ACOCTG_04935, partial [Bacteroidota bacterium]